MLCLWRCGSRGCISLYIASSCEYIFIPLENNSLPEVMVKEINGLVTFNHLPPPPPPPPTQMIEIHLLWYTAFVVFIYWHDRACVITVINDGAQCILYIHYIGSHRIYRRQSRSVRTGNTPFPTTWHSSSSDHFICFMKSGTCDTL